jgi:hypothetical protein
MYILKVVKDYKTPMVPPGGMWMFYLWGEKAIELPGVVIL